MDVPISTHKVRVVTEGNGVGCTPYIDIYFARCNNKVLMRVVGGEELVVEAIGDCTGMM